MNHYLRTIAGSFALGVAAYFASRLGTNLAGLTNDVAAVWLPSAMLLGVLLRCDWRSWSPYLAAFYISQIAANLTFGEGWLLAAIYPLGDIAGPVIGAIILSRVVSLPMRMETLRDMFSLLGYAAIVGQGLGAILGAVTAVVAFGSEFWTTWFTWWASGAVGMVFVTPPILVFERILALRKLPVARLAELAVLLGLAVALTVFAGTEHEFPLLYVVSPVLLWAALRYDVSGAALINAVTAAVVVLASLESILGTLPAEELGHLQSVLFVQLYLSVLFLPGLIVSTLFEQLRVSRNELAAITGRYKDFADATSDWQWEMDENLRYKDFSSGFERASGNAAADLIGKERADIAVQPEDEDFRNHLDDLQNHRAFRNFRYRFHTADGRLGLAEISGKPIYDESDAFAGYRGTGTDVTQDAEAEKRFQTIYDHANIGIMFTGPDDGIERANSTIAEFLQYSEAELQTMSLSDITHADDRPEASKVGAGAPDGPAPTPAVEIRYVRKDGQIVWGLLSATVIRDNVGRPRYFIHMVQDVTERKAIETALKESEQRSLEACRIAGLNHWILDAESWMLTDGEDRLKELAGIDAGENLSDPAVWERHVHEDDKPIYRNLVRDLKAWPHDYSGEYRIVRSDGEIRTVYFNCRPSFDDQGRLLRYRGTLQDVTDMRGLESQLRQAQKMEAIGQLTGGLAHDFNNMLAVIQGRLDLMQPSARRRNDKFGGHVEAAQRACQRAAQLAHRLLAFARKQPLQPQATDVGDLLQRSTELLGTTLGDSIKIEIASAPSLWRASVDPGQLESTILNLAINARDAMADGGTFTIETANTVIDDRYAALESEISPGRYVMLAFSDTGAGMSPEDAGRAFDPFFTTKEVGQGSGLGLSMVFGFVKQSGGHIKIDSELDQGTTINIYLPIAQEDDQRLPVQTGKKFDAPKGHGELVLVVEDELELRDLYTIMLTTLGYQVASASDGPEAVATIVGGKCPAILLTDIIMPGGTNGYELARQCLKLDPGLAVLFMSGYAGTAARNGSLVPDNAMHIGKPFGKVELARGLRDALESRA